MLRFTHPHDPATRMVAGAGLAATVRKDRRSQLQRAIEEAA
jgi:hypothetical protein